MRGAGDEVRCGSERTSGSEPNDKKSDMTNGMDSDTPAGPADRGTAQSLTVQWILDEKHGILTAQVVARAEAVQNPCSSDVTRARNPLQEPGQRWQHWCVSMDTFSRGALGLHLWTPFPPRDFTVIGS